MFKILNELVKIPIIHGYPSGQKNTWWASVIKPTEADECLQWLIRAMVVSLEASK